MHFAHSCTQNIERADVKHVAAPTPGCRATRDMASTLFKRSVCRMIFWHFESNVLQWKKKCINQQIRTSRCNVIGGTWQDHRVDGFLANRFNQMRWQRKSDLRSTQRSNNVPNLSLLKWEKVCWKNRFYHVCVCGWVRYIHAKREYSGRVFTGELPGHWIVPDVMDEVVKTQNLCLDIKVVWEAKVCGVRPQQFISSRSHFYPRSSVALACSDN